MPEELKPFHELTEKEWQNLVSQKLTWEEVRKKHPGPKWCSEGFIAGITKFGFCLSLYRAVNIESIQFIGRA